MCNTWYTCVPIRSQRVKQWQRSRCELDREKYKLRKREAKRVVAQSKVDSLDAWCEELRYATGRRKMFAIAKQMKKEKKDIVGGYFVKKTSGEIATTEENITLVWKEYFSTLLNVENNNEIEEAECVHGPIQHISENEVRTALRSMKANKAPGPSGLTSDIIKPEKAKCSVSEHYGWWWMS